MKKILSVMMLALFLLNTLWAYTGEVIKSFDTPGSCPTGLTYDGKSLWLADRKADRLFCINPKSGKVIKSIDSPAYWPMGLCWDGEALWNSDWKERKIYRINPQTGIILKAVDAPEGSPRGLAWDGKYLWCADERADKIIQFSPDDGTTIREFKSPANDPRGLCFDGTYLWVSDRIKDEIYMVDPESGCVVLITEAPGPFTRGLAFDGKNLWAADYQNDKIYQLKVRDKELFIRKNERRAKVMFTHQVKNFGPNNIKTLDVHLAIPVNRDNQEINGEIVYTPNFTKIVTDKWGQKTALFSMKNLENQTIQNVISVVDATVYETRYFIFPDKVGSLKKIPKDIAALYLENNEKYQVDHPVIQDALNKCVGEEKNPYWIARKIFNYLIENMYYEMVGGWNTAPTVLTRGNGSCSEYTFVYTAMCRAAGLPARYVGSVVVRNDDASMDDVFHRWAEVYLPNYGWIPVDPSGGDNEQPRDQANYFGHLANRFLITTESGGGSKTMGWTYNSNEFWTSEPQTKVEIETIAEWEPAADN
jgi:transglutaminase-like putative cysteine protease/sugar lactone lactonase YvrE